MPYYKATLAGGVSQHEPVIVYHLGLNVHPNPDKKSTDSWGEGIHLAKTIKATWGYVPDATEIYEAEAGVILGEDDDKIRVSYCWLTRLIPKEEWVTELEQAKADAERQAKEREILKGIKPPPICGMEWLENHRGDITWDDWNKQTLEVSSDRHKITISAKLKRKDLKIILAGMR